MRSIRSFLSARRRLAALTVTTVVVGLGVVLAAPAVADPGPVASRASTGVTADALPTVQVDGVVWTQVVSGNVVYAGGDFTTARPAGAAANTSTVTRNNLLAYNITTGALITSFAPSLDAQVRALAVSPDGKTLYVGGSFSSANGQDRYRIAAYDTATGALLSSFQPGTDATVSAIVATNTTVYLGGAFSNVNDVPRARLAAVRASDGALLSWAPTADNNEVETMVMNPAGDKLIVGGSFTTVNGSSSGYGLAALDPTNGSLLPWTAANVIKDAGTTSQGGAAILNLSTDGKAIYGSGYDYYGNGNLEGAFSADPSSGAINWIEDCHGDTYGTYGVNNAVYTVSHAHDCTRTGDFPQTNPEGFHRALAWTANATGTLLHNQVGGYTDWGGQPSPSLINWFPDLEPGSFTGQIQAAWTVSGNGQYVVLGGEFPSVNGVAQQGLVRFAVPGQAPNKQGPMVSGANYQTSETAVSATSVRVSWPANWDRDDQSLTYQLIRNGDSGHPIYTTTAQSQFWNQPTLSYVDTGLTANTAYTYYVIAKDPSGNTVRGDYTTITTPKTSPSAYAQQVLIDNPADYWRFDEASGATTAKDFAGNSPLTEQSGVTEGAAGAIVGDSDTAANFSGSSTGSAATSTQIAGPNTFSLETWFKTSTTRGGRLIGFSSSQTGSSAAYDRQIYLDNAGHVIFGTYNNATQTVTSSATYRDNAWHQVVATMSSAGMVLYVDGAVVGKNTSATVAQGFSGYWRIGGDNLNGWPSQPSSAYFAGTIDETAVYPVALSLATVQSHYSKSGRTVTGTTAPTAAFTSTCTNLSCSFDASGSSAASGATVSSYAWTFGDNTSGTGAKVAHAYSGAGSYPVTLTVTDSKGGTGSVTHTVTPTAPATPTAAFTSSCQNLSCSFDGSTSKAVGSATITSYAWNFGDSKTATGATTSHVYAAAGSYTVTLTVTDSANRTGTVSKTVTVAQGAVKVVGDAFGRTVTGGWGTADTGGPWTVDDSSAFAVAGGTGQMTFSGPGATESAALASVSTRDLNLLFDVGMSKAPTGNGLLVSVGARHTSAGEYRLKVRFLADGTVHLVIAVVTAAAGETVLSEVAVPNLTYTAGQLIHVRMQVTGSGTTSIAGKAWTGATEPAANQISVTDTTSSLQGAGSLTVLGYVAGNATNTPVQALLDNLSGTSG